MSICHFYYIYTVFFIAFYQIPSRQFLQYNFWKLLIMNCLFIAFSCSRFLLSSKVYGFILFLYVSVDIFYIKPYNQGIKMRCFHFTLLI